MKISIDSAKTAYLSSINQGVKNARTDQIRETGKNFDRIMINTNSRRIAEEQLAEAARKEAAKGVFCSTSEEKIAGLKAQIARGTYTVNPEEVAAKILYMKGEF